jgi:hypothetical protein
LKKYSDGFNEIFTFFLRSYRSGLLTFCGTYVDVYSDLEGPEGKFTFRKYDNGDYKTEDIKTCHPNIVRGVITGKKSWGLHVKQWSEGIADWCFTKEEIVNTFTRKGIRIPEPLMNDFNNHIEKHKQKRYK